MEIGSPASLSSIWIVYAIMLPLACVLAGVGWWMSHLRQPHPQGKLIATVTYLISAWCLLIPVVLLFQEINGYNRLELSNDGKTLTVRYPLFHAPKVISVNDLKLLHVDQLWVPRGATHQYYWRIVPETIEGERLEPNWEFRLCYNEKPGAEYRQLEKFVSNAKQLGVPLKFTFKDPDQIVHDTESIADRPNDREQIPDRDARLFP